MVEMSYFKKSRFSFADFDKQVRESKEAAHEALKEIPSIQKTINQTITETDEARRSLAGAKQTAESALQTAEEAEELAMHMSERAESIKNEAEQLHNNVTNLQNEAGLMAERVENTVNEFNTLLTQTKKNESLISQAKDTVNYYGN